MTVEERDGITRLALTGKLDAKGVDAIEVRFVASTSNRAKVAVDLTGVDYLASMGIRLLVIAGKAAARRGGKLVLFGADAGVAKIVTSAGLDGIVPLLADWPAVLAAMA